MTNNKNRNQNQNQNKNQNQNQNEMREEFGSTFDVDKLKEQNNTKKRKERF